MPASVVVTGWMVLETSRAGDADARAAGQPAADEDVADADSKTRDQVLWDKETNDECCGGDDVQQNLGLIAGLLLSLIPCLLVLVGLVVRTSSSKVTGNGKNRRMQTRRVGCTALRAAALLCHRRSPSPPSPPPLPPHAPPPPPSPPGAPPPPYSPPPPLDVRLDRAVSTVVTNDAPLLNSTARFRALRGRVPLPSHDVVRATMAKLQRSSCAVVGAAPSLRGCRRLDELCTRFDIVIRVNDHAPVDACGRADIQVCARRAAAPRSARSHASCAALRSQISTRACPRWTPA